MMNEERNAMNGETEETMTAEENGRIEDGNAEPGSEENAVAEGHAEEDRDGTEELRADG